MGFNDQYKRKSEEAATKSSIFKTGVKYKRLTQKNKTIVFRILPAFNPDDILTGAQLGYADQPDAQFVNPNGWLPYRLENDAFTNWAAIIELAVLVGHGSPKSGCRVDLVLPSTFAAEGETVDDLYKTLYKRASTDAEWSYMTKDIMDGTVKVDSAALSRPASNMLCNVVDINETQEGVVIGLLNTGAYNSLCSQQNAGLCWQRNNMPEAMIKQNYLLRWAVVDLTSPTDGPVLSCSQGTDKGERSPYAVRTATDAHGNVRRWPLQPANLLECRRDLTNPRELLTEFTNEMTIKALVGALNLKNRNGIHESYLLKDMFGDVYGNLIPTPAPAQGGVNTVQGVSLPGTSAMPANTGFGRPPRASGVPPPTPAIPRAQPASAPMQAPAQPEAEAGDEDNLPFEQPTSAPVQTAPVPPAAPVTAQPTPAAPQAAPAQMPPMVPQGKPLDRDAFMKRIQGAKPG